MIFKTFQTDLDGISNKIGFSKRSFAEWGKQVSASFKESEGVVNSFKNALKTAFSVPIKNDNSWIKNEFGEIVDKENIDSYISQLVKEDASNLVRKIREQSIAVADAKDGWEDYFAQLKGRNQEYIVDLIKNTDDLSKLTGEDLVKACDEARKAAIAHNEEIKNMSFSAKAGKVAPQTLATVGNMIAMWAISKGLELAVKGIDNLIHSSEKCKERVDELISSYQSALGEANSNAKAAENLASRYEELSKGVNNLGQNLSLTAEEYTEYNDIVNQIAGMFPQLIQGYTDEGNAILSLKGNVKQLRDAYKQAQQEAYGMLVISGEDSDGNDILKNADTVLNGDWRNNSRLKQVAFIDEIEDALYDTEKLIGLWRSLKDRSLSYSSWFVDYTGLYTDRDIKNLTADDISGIQNELKTVKKKYRAEIDDAVSSTRTMLEAYLKVDDLYGELDEESARIASILVNSIDAEIVATFKNNPSAVNDYVQNILEAVNNPDIHDSIIHLFTLDTKDMSVEDAKAEVDDYIHDIAAVLGESEYELKVRLGFEDVDATYKMLHHAVRSITNTGDPLLAITNIDEYNELLSEINWKEFTKEEAEFFVTATRGAENAAEAIRAYRDALEETAMTSSTTPLSITETVNQINTRLKSAFDSLQSAYQGIFTVDEDTGEKLFTPLDKTDITDKFKPILDALEELDSLDGINVNYSAYEDFVSVLSDTSSTAEEVQAQFNRLATNLIYTSDCTNMSAETFHLLAKSLSEMGITNAYDVLNDILELQESLTDESLNVESAMSGEVETLKNLTFASDETAEHLMAYYVQKLLAENPISTSDDMLQLERLCHALGVTGEVYETIIALKRAFSAKESGVHSSGLDDSIAAYRQKLTDLAAGYGTFHFDFESANTKSSSSSGTPFSGQGTSRSTPDPFDWTTTAIDRVEKEIETLDEIANSAYSTFSQKNEALTQEIGKVSEEIDLQQQAYADYMNRAEAVGLSDHYKNLVQNGSPGIEDITDETLKDRISEYRKWYEKAQDVSKTIKALNTDMKDLYVSAYELQTGNLKERLDSDSITQKQYLDGLKEAYERFYADLEDFSEQYHEAVLEHLAEEKDYLNNVAGSAASVLDTEIDKIQENAASQENNIQRQIDLLQAKKKPLQDELDALEDKERRENLIFHLQKAQYELARSENQRTKLLYKDGQMVYTSDPTAITNAKKEVDEASLEIQKQSIQDRIDALDDEIDRYNNLIDQINQTADAQIDALDKIKSKWLEVIDQQEYVKNVTLLTGEFGKGAVTQILTGNDDDLLKRWKNNYISTLSGIDMESQGYISEMTGQIASLYDVDLSSLQSQFQNVTDSISGVTDASGNAASSIGIGIGAPTTRVDAEGEPASNNSLTDSVTNLGTISNETLPYITSNMDDIAATAANASLEVSNVANAIHDIPESKDVTISVHTVGVGSVSGRTSSQLSQTAYIEGNAYASGIKHAERGLAVVGEEKPEVIITNDKKAFLAKEPALLNMEGGETVFDGNTTARMLKARGLKPISAEESPLLKALSPYSPDEIRQRFVSSLTSPAKNAASSAIQNANHAIDNFVNNKTSCTINDVHINCPGITKDEVAKQIGAELTNVFTGMSLNAYQRANITR